MYNYGIVIGKFYPPHAGHHFVIDKALDHCNRVTVIVVDRPIGIEREIPASIRAAWLQEIHPTANVQIYIQPDWLPNEDSKLWADVTVQNFGRPDAVFSSESYAEAWAGLMNCANVQVDAKRTFHEVSGTEVRKDPFKYWHKLREPVRAWYVKRVVITGAESTGTTTLTKTLAEYYQTAYVPEYGRILYEGFVNCPNSPNLWTPRDLERIAQLQIEIEDELARKANKILFCDTDIMTTIAWFERYWPDKSSRELSRLARRVRSYAGYILTESDFPFVQDGFRPDPPEGRAPLQERLRWLVRDRPHNLTVTGDHAKRLDAAIKFINKEILNVQS